MLNAEEASCELVPLDAIDLFDPRRFQTGSQHPAWRTLRAQAPVWPQEVSGSCFWSVTRYEDVLRVVKDHRTFSSEHGTILAVLGGDSAGGKTINLMDPPAHTGIRVPTMRLLSTAEVGRVAGRLRERVRAILRPALDGGELDLVPLMMQLPMAAVGDILGVPEDRWLDVTRWTMAGVAPTDPHYSLGTPDRTLRTVHFELFSLFRDLARERRSQPRDDITSALLATEICGRKLTFEEVVLNCYSFAMGANTTTPHVASHLALALAQHPDQWQKVRAEPAVLSLAVEEGLRWATPTNHLVRRTTRPVSIAGRELPSGELVCAWVASANRDERVFPRPYSFDVTRKPNPHLAFGQGIHYCNGAPGARLIIRLMLEELTAVAEQLTISGPVRHLSSNFINGITELPVSVRRDRTRRPQASGVTRAGCPADKSQPRLGPLSEVSP